jgi:hypothetical protein
VILNSYSPITFSGVAPPRETSQSNWEKLIELASVNNMVPFDVGGEGNCLFLCLAAIVYNDPTKHLAVRKVKFGTFLQICTKLWFRNLWII